MRVIALWSLALAVIPTSELAAKGPQSTIRVTAPMSVEAWAGAVGKEVDRQLTRRLRSLAAYRHSPAGFVSVRFRTDSEGQPSSIEVARSSRSRQLDDVAVRSIRRTDLPTLPPGIAPDRTFIVHVIVSSDDKDIANYRTEIANRAAAVAAGRGDALVIGVVHRRSS